MTVKELIIKYAKENGFDGLCDPDNEYGCEISDLAPCGESPTACSFGHKVDNHADGYDFHIITS